MTNNQDVGEKLTTRTARRVTRLTLVLLAVVVKEVVIVVVVVMCVGTVASSSSVDDVVLVELNLAVSVFSDSPCRVKT